MREAWDEAVKNSGGVRPTAKAVNEAADKRREHAREVRHQSESSEWMTPDRILVCVRDFLGRIDLDPASTAEANARVRAGAFYQRDDDGLAHEWWGKVFLNPPYGFDAHRVSMAQVWSQHLLKEYAACRVEEAILLVNAEVGSRWFRPLLDYPVCFPPRIRFLRPGGEVAQQPTHANALVYIGPRKASDFARAFYGIGITVVRQAA